MKFGFARLLFFFPSVKKLRPLTIFFLHAASLSPNLQSYQTCLPNTAYMKNNNFAKYDSKADLVADINKRAQHGANSMPEVLGGGSGSNSPVWMRDYSDPNDKPPKNPKAQQMIDATLFHLRADRMVMGHTVQREINVALNGKAWRIDVGASRGVMGGTPEVLEVVMKDGKEVVSILNDKKGKIPAKERQINVSVASAVSSMLSG